MPLGTKAPHAKLVETVTDKVITNKAAVSRAELAALRT